MSDAFRGRSQQFQTMKGVTESLAGRVGVVNLMGLSQRELIGDVQSDQPFIPDLKRVSRGLRSGRRLPLEEMYRSIWRGSFPAIATDAGMDRDLFYRMGMNAD